jgi:hypothetical protein
MKLSAVWRGTDVGFLRLMACFDGFCFYGTLFIFSFHSPLYFVNDAYSIPLGLEDWASFRV